MKIEDVPKDCIRTHSGLFLNVFEPTVEMICVEDIAHALSQQPRFAGHLGRFYSVAQHSYHCCELASEKNKLPTLMHDGSEFALLDMPTPIKARMPEYKKIESHLMEIIAKAFGFQYPYDPEIKKIDTYMLHLEWDNLVVDKNPNFVCFTPEEAEKKFLEMYYEITKKK